MVVYFTILLLIWCVVQGTCLTMVNVTYSKTCVQCTVFVDGKQLGSMSQGNDNSYKSYHSYASFLHCIDLDHWYNGLQTLY